MERAPPPSPAAAALAALDDVLMDTHMSPKRPRQDDPPNQVGAGAKKAQLELPFFCHTLSSISI